MGEGVIDWSKIPKKEGIMEKDGVMIVVGSRNLARVAQAMSNETRARIMEILAKRPEGLDAIAEEIGQSKANVSSQIRKLEEAGIVEPKYQPGSRGIKKLVALKVKAIVFVLDRPEE